MAQVYVAIFQCADEAVPHWCLYTVDDDGDGTVFEALGFMGQNFKFTTRQEDIFRSTDLSETPDVGRIEADVWPEAQDLLKTVPVNNKPGWNCQSWVMEAITALNEAGYLEETEPGKTGLSRIKSRFQRKWKDTYLP